METSHVYPIISSHRTRYAFNFAALAQMVMMETGKKLRIQRRTVTDMSEGSSVEFMVGLKSGGMLGIESDNVDHAAVLEFAEQFPIAELDDSL